MSFKPFKLALKLLKSIDMFGRKTELKMNKHSKYNTHLGGLFSLIMLSICIPMFLNFGSDMLYHQNPTAIFSQVFSKNPERYYFSQEKYFFMFGIEAPDTYAHFIDETIYQVNIINRGLSKTSDDSFNIPLERCSEDKLPHDKQIHEYFINAPGSPINDLYCIKNLENYYIEGSFDTDNYAFIEIMITACQNKTENSSAPICKSPEEIEAKLSGYFAFYTMDYLIDPNNFKNPGQQTGKDYFTPISIGMTRNTNRYIATSKINSDDGFLFSSINNYNYPSYYEDKETLLIDKSNQGLIIDFVLRKYHNDLIYTRNYQKFQDVLAQIGGIIQILSIFFSYLSFPFVDKLYFEKIVNSIYNFEGINLINRKSTKILNKSLIHYNQNLKSFQEIFGAPNSNIVKVNPNTVQIIQNSKEIEKERGFIKYLLKIQNKPPLQTTYWEFFKNKFFPLVLKKKSKKRIKDNFQYERLNKGKNLIIEKLDFAYILKKLYEVDKLKMLLLNENQYHLFEYSSKPVIQNNSEINFGNSKNAKFISLETDTMNKAKRLFHAYNEIINQKELSEMDKKLIDILEDNVKLMLNV